MLAYNDQYTALVNPLQICELLRESMNACAPVWIFLIWLQMCHIHFQSLQSACLSLSSSSC